MFSAPFGCLQYFYPTNDDNQQIVVRSPNYPSTFTYGLSPKLDYYVCFGTDDVKYPVEWNTLWPSTNKLDVPGGHPFQLGPSKEGRALQDKDCSGRGYLGRAIPDEGPIEFCGQRFALEAGSTEDREITDRTPAFYRIKVKTFNTPANGGFRLVSVTSRIAAAYSKKGSNSRPEPGNARIGKSKDGYDELIVN